ncbi:MAG: hypothetical protein KC549_03025 [Myxococcales bacterium]|nr:hypothetical protein [Myxococcales bacterium]
MTRLPAGCWLVLALCFGGCGDDLRLGLSGCSPGEPFPATPENTVAAGAHVTVTAAGTDFLLAQRELLAGLLLDVGPDGWVRLPLPTFDFGSNGGLGVGVRDLVAAFDLRTVDLRLAFLADPTRLRIDIRRARIRLDDGVVWVSVGGDAACRLGNGLDAGTPQAALLDADFTIDVTLGVTEDARLDVHVDVLPFTIHGLDFELLYDPNLPECADGSSSAECRISCGVGDAAAEIGEALYFTRANAPWGDGPVYHHIGLYAFTRTALDRFAALPPSPLERREKLEQLRALENGMRIGVKLVQAVPFGVDTPADLMKARKILGDG